MSYSADLWHFIAVYLLVLVAPGLDFAVVLRESALFGRKSGVLAALGVASAVAVHCAYTVLGLGLIIAQSLLLFNLIKYAGIAYLLYIGAKALLAKKSGGAEMIAAARAQMQARPPHKAFVTGFLCNLLNPKCLLFFLSVFSALIAPSAPLGVKGLASAAVVACCAVWFCCVAVFLTMPRVSRLYRKAGQWIDKATGALFIALGLGLIFQKAQL